MSGPEHPWSNDPINIQWDDSEMCNIHLQNSGDTFLDVELSGSGARGYHNDSDSH